MSGYLRFNGSPVECIGDIASAINLAGDSFHHTEMWDEEMYDGEPSVAQGIQNALDAAEKYIVELERQIERMEPIVEMFLANAREHNKNPDIYVCDCDICKALRVWQDGGMK